MFKAFMTNPNSREMVSNLISELTGIAKEDLRKATYIGGEEIAKRNMKEKKQSTDMTIKIAEHMQIIVEMNQSYQQHILEKNAMYAMSRIVETTRSKRKYTSVILINFDNFNRYSTKKPMLIFRIQDEEGHIEIENYKSIHILLANCEKNPYNIGKETEKFANFLKRETTIEKLEQDYRGDEEYMSVIRTVAELSQDPEFAGYYDLEEKHRQQIEDAKETGYDEGIQEGIQKGIHEGIQKGEHNKAISTAKKMLAKNITIEDIQEITDLSLDEIKALQKGI